MARMADRDEQLLLDCISLIYQFTGNRFKGLKIRNRINGLIKHLYKKYRVYRSDIESELIVSFIERKRHLKYDPALQPLQVYVGYFIYFSLLNLRKKLKRRQKRLNEFNFSERRYWNDVLIDGPPAILQDEISTNELTYTVTPEDQFLHNELMSLAEDYFDELDLAVLFGAITRKKAAKKAGVTYEAHCKCLQRKLQQFRSFLKDYGYGY